MGDVVSIKDKVEARVATEQGGGQQTDGGGNEVTSAFVRQCLERKELGDGELFVALHRGRFLYSASGDEWFYWTGHHWALDVLGLAVQEVEAVAERYDEEIDIAHKELPRSKEDDEDKYNRLERLKKNLRERIGQIRSNRRRRAVLEAAHTCRDPLAVGGEELDRDPWLLGCANGVLDLRTGELRDGRPEDYITKASPVEWQGLDAQAEVWREAVLEIFQNDQDLVDYVQRLFGSALCGVTTEHIFPVLYGQGRNGKSMMVETFAHVLGDLAGPIPAEMLLDQGRARSSSGPSPDIMALRGLRLAIASETDEGRRLSAAQVKLFTGGDTLTGRNPHDKRPSRFKPTHRLVLLTNHRPRIDAGDFALWERVHLIPFLLSFVDRKPVPDSNERVMDKTLPGRLLQEGPGILAWLVEGCLAWQKLGGLKPPAVVTDATGEYRRDQDLAMDFVDQACDLGESLDSEASELYEAFKRWYMDTVSKRNPPSQKKFGGWMARIHSVRKEKQNGRYRYFGIAPGDKYGGDKYGGDGEGY